MRLKHALLAAALISPLVSQAGIMSDMNSMFMSNSTAPGVLSTKDRVGAFGGNFSMRSPVKSVNIVAFDPPRLNAGCGGIDLSGGSFSFINGQQLIQIFRSVASNAAGLAFKAAIKAISPSLDALISEFQTLLQSMNNLAKNSCQLAHLVVDPAEQAISNAVNGDGAVGATSKNMFTDTMGALTGYLADANSMFSKQAEANPKSGNQIVKAVVSSGSSSILGIAGLSNLDGSTDDASNPNSLNNRLLISMLGYEIAGIPCSTTNALGQPNTSQLVSSNNLGTISCTGTATVALDDLVKGGGVGSPRPDAPLQLYRCVNPAGPGTTNGGFDPQICTQMQTANFNYAGVEGWVNTMLFGGANASSTPAADSIVGKFNTGTSVILSMAQVQFIKQSGLPLPQLLQRVSNPDSRISIAQSLGGHAVNCVAARLGDALYKAANGVQNSDGYVVSPDVKKRIDQLRTDYLAKQELCNASPAVLKVVQLLDASTRVMAGNSK